MASTSQGTVILRAANWAIYLGCAEQKRKKTFQNQILIRRREILRSTHLLIDEENASKGNKHLDPREYSLLTFGSKNSSSYRVHMNIAGQRLEMEVDTGASLSVISKKTYENVVSGRRHVHWKHLELSFVLIREEVKPKGSSTVGVCHGGKPYCLPLLFVWRRTISVRKGLAGGN